MEAKELRIGNYVMHEGKIRQIQLYQIENAPECEPVILSPEILEKCPLLSFDGMYWYNEYFNVYFRFKKDGFYQISATNRIGVKMEYLHDFQNRFYSLTSQELTIKL